jgi:hypothetical protein
MKFCYVDFSNFDVFYVPIYPSDIPPWVKIPYKMNCLP